MGRASRACASAHAEKNLRAPPPVPHLVFPKPAYECYEIRMPWNIERKENVALVVMNTNKVNAQNEAFFADLDEAFDRLESQYSDCAVVLTGQGKVFSAGLDFEEVFGLFGSRNEKKIQDWFERYRATNLRVFTYPKPVIAAVNGSAIAGGLITALNCDYRIGVAEESKFSLNEVPIGIPMPGTYLEIIRHAVGTHNASVLSLFGEMYSTQQAIDLGVLHVTVQRSDLVDAALRFARKISPDALTAFAFSKAAIQAPALQRIESLNKQFDSKIAETICNDGSIRALAAQYKALKGEYPSWFRA